MLSILGSKTREEAIYNIIAISVWIVLITFLLRYLWNESLVKHISVLKSVDTLPQTLLLAIAIALFKC
jgi:hypothetical protein